MRLQIDQQFGDFTSMEPSEVVSLVSLKEIAKVPPEKCGEILARWCEMHDDVLSANERGSEGEDRLFDERVSWMLWRLRYETVSGRNFSAKWIGTIEAPRSGEYRFSICPINPSYENPAESQFLRQSMQVSIDGKRVLDANGNDWKSESLPVALQAGQPLSIQVNFQHSRQVSTEPTNGICNPVALLYWEGPGISKAIVPSSALAPPDGNGPGLLGTYQSDENGNARTINRVEQVVDHNWLFGRCIVPPHEAQQNKLLELAWKRYSQPGYIDKCFADPLSAYFYDRQFLLECIGHERRRQVLEWVAQRPELMRMRPWWSVNQVFLNLRHDDPEAALDVLGAWLTANTSELPELSNNG